MPRMCRIIVLVCLLSGALCACLSSSCCAAVREGTQPGDFLYMRAESPAALADQIISNKMVADNYRRHFGISRDALVNYIRQNVEIRTLDKDYRGTVHFISAGRKIGQRNTVLRKGTRVFAVKNGPPIMEWRCGNPLTKQLPAIVASKPTPPAPVVTEPEVAGVVEAVEIGQTLASAPAAVPLAVVPATVTTGIPAIEPPIPFAPALAMVAPALVAGVAVKSSAAPTVPEPASSAALFIGGAMVILHMRRRSRGL